MNVCKVWQKSVKYLLTYQRTPDFLWTDRWTDRRKTAGRTEGQTKWLLSGSCISCEALITLALPLYRQINTDRVTGNLSKEKVYLRKILSENRTHFLYHSKNTKHNSPSNIAVKKKTSRHSKNNNRFFTRRKYFV